MSTVNAAITPGSVSSMRTDSGALGFLFTSRKLSQPLMRTASASTGPIIIFRLFILNTGPLP